MTTLVRHAMTEAPKTLKSSMTVRDAAGLMASHDIGAVPVADEDGSLIGLVTDRDLVTRALATQPDPGQVRLADLVTRAVVTVSPDAELSQARELMTEHRIRRLLVLKGNELVGILSLGDIALHLASARSLGELLKDVSESQSTQSLNEGPDRGTPDRVREANHGGSSHRGGSDGARESS